MKRKAVAAVSSDLEKKVTIQLQRCKVSNLEKKLPSNYKDAKFQKHNTLFALFEERGNLLSVIFIQVLFSARPEYYFAIWQCFASLNIIKTESLGKQLKLENGYGKATSFEAKPLNHVKSMFEDMWYCKYRDQYIFFLYIFIITEVFSFTIILSFSFMPL